MIFTFDELTELATAPGDRALSALNAGRVEEARTIAAESVNAHFPIRDIYTGWNAMTLAYVQGELGAVAADECLVCSLQNVVRPWVEWFRNGVSREAVLLLAQLIRMDVGELAAVEEDEQRLTLTARGWAGARVAAMPGMPDFRTVTAAIERLCVDWLGYPPFVLDVDADGDTLRAVVHKDPSAIPVTEFERLGVVRDTARLAAAFSVGGARLFDPDELEPMRFQAYARAVDAIDRADLERARRHLALSKTEWYPAHHFGRDWVTAMLSWVHDNHGVDRAWDCVEVAYNRPVMGQMITQVADLDLRSQVQMLAVLFHQHGMKYRIIESNAGFEFHTVPCGSGGRLIDEHAYAAPKAFATVRGNSVESFGLDEMPIYCMHCPATNRMVLERGGPHFLLVEPDLHPDGRLRGHCSFHIFKEPGAVPSGMYDRVGLSAPILEPVLAGAGLEAGRIR